jgi:cysteine-rich repeat protein
MRSKSNVVACALGAALLAGCLDEKRGASEVGEPDVAEETSVDVAAETEVDTTPDVPEEVAPEVEVTVCGNGAVEPGEPCDDGNTCAGDGCATCVVEDTVVLTRLALVGGAGFDLDDKDGDGDVTTGVDNVLGAQAIVGAKLDEYVGDLIASGDVIQLATFSGLDDPRDDREFELVLHPGKDPACRDAGPFPWLTAPGADLQSMAFPGCVAPAVVRTSDHPDNGLVAGHLVAAAQTIVLPLGGLGTFGIGRGRLEADLSGAQTIETMVGELGGVLPAAALYRIDTSAFLPQCPTALHAVLGLLGHIDQDTNGDGLDFVRWTTTAGATPCINGPVVISGCCIGGDCAEGLVSGAECVLDARMRDGYSVGFEVSAQRVRVTGTSSDVCE